MTDFIFMGLAEHVRQSEAPYPDGDISLLNLSTRKAHVIYPVWLTAYRWVFVIAPTAVLALARGEAAIQVMDVHGAVVGNAAFHTGDPPADSVTAHRLTVPLHQPSIVPIEFKGMLVEPQMLSVVVRTSAASHEIGQVQFDFVPTPPFTLDQLRAIQADPHAVKTVKMILACTACKTRMETYAALDRDGTLESQGCRWHAELPDYFRCTCGGASVPLQYLRQGLHGLLGADKRLQTEQIGYTQRYQHSEIVNVTRTYSQLLDRTPPEAEVQEFLQQHPVLFARFHPRRVYIKPDVLGRFQPDFAFLDSQSRLILVELERPGLVLFKQDGHPTAELMHAYGQVTDWMQVCRDNPQAFYQVFELRPDQVASVQGCVIAGRADRQPVEHLHRHLAFPLYGAVQFLTLDDLATSLLLISRDMAAEVHA